MKTKTKIAAILTATLITLAPVSANAASFSDGVFSWPTDYKSQKASKATSTFDGKVKNLKTKQTDKNKPSKAKRK